MRSVLLAVLVVSLVGCEPPRGDCLCFGPQEVTVGEGEVILENDSLHALAPVTRGCSRRSTLYVYNPASVTVDLSVTSDSPDIRVVSGSGALAANNSAIIELVARSNETAIFLASELTVDVSGLPPKKFKLIAELTPRDAEQTRTFDFGGVQVGARRRLPAEPMNDLRGDFAQSTNGTTLEFLPTGVGRQQLEATYGSMLDCPSLSKVTLVGDGVPAVLSGPAAIDFGGVSVGSSTELDVELSNYSFEAMRAELSAVGSPSYAVVIQPSSLVASRNGSGVLVPGTSIARVRFAPSSQGAVLQELAVVSGAHTLLIPVRGTGL